MNKVLQLEGLSLSELNTLLSHLRLGTAHLKKQLTPRQLSNLLSLGSLNYNQLVNVSSNRLEKSGNIALVLNTVITSVFGAWMGFSGFMGLHLNSYLVLSLITTLAVLVSSLVGFLSFKLTHDNAKSALHKQKIYNIQTDVLKLILSKQKDKITSYTKFLNNALEYVVNKSDKLSLSISVIPFQFENNQEYLQWLNLMDKVITNKIHQINKYEICHFYSKRLASTLNKIKESIELSYLVSIPPTPALEERYGSYLYRKKNSFIKLLSRPRSIVYPKQKIKSWIKQNYLSLLAGIFPTLLGGFASMFVFLSGGPNLAKELGLINLEHILRHPSSRMIELSIALGLTSYYGLSFAYNNYKSHIREQEVNRVKIKLNELETEDTDLKKRSVILNTLKNNTKRIINIYTAIDNIQNFIKEKEISL